MTYRRGGSSAHRLPGLCALLLLLAGVLVAGLPGAGPAAPTAAAPAAVTAALAAEAQDAGTEAPNRCSGQERPVAPAAVPRPHQDPAQFSACAVAPAAHPAAGAAADAVPPPGRTDGSTGLDRLTVLRI